MSLQGHRSTETRVELQLMSLTDLQGTFPHHNKTLYKLDPNTFLEVSFDERL